MSRFYYYVSPNPSGGWDAYGEGQQRVHFDTKEKALAAAVTAGRKSWEDNKRKSGVRVQLANGQWQEERTYGDDPFPPRG